MSMEELQALLAEGKLTQAQFSMMAQAMDQAMGPRGARESQEESSSREEATPTGQDRSEGGKSDKESPSLQELVQRAVDRATHKLGNENKRLREQMELFKRTRMTEAEAAEMDRQQREEALLEKERALQDRENRLYALKSIKAAGLDDGGDAALALVDLVLSENSGDIDAKVEAFGTLVRRFVQAQVDKTFQTFGSTPEKSGGLARGSNPFAKESFNITEQMRLEAENPELAAQLKAGSSTGQPRWGS